MSKRRAYLALADGTIFEGRAHGKDGSTTGEVVFTTGMPPCGQLRSDQIR